MRRALKAAQSRLPPPGWRLAVRRNAPRPAPALDGLGYAGMVSIVQSMASAEHDLAERCLAPAELDALREALRRQSITSPTTATFIDCSIGTCGSEVPGLEAIYSRIVRRDFSEEGPRRAAKAYMKSLHGLRHPGVWQQDAADAARKLLGMAGVGKPRIRRTDHEEGFVELRVAPTDEDDCIDPFWAQAIGLALLVLRTRAILANEAARIERNFGEPGKAGR